MKQIYAAALLVLAIVLASCAPEAPPYFTWCYGYDFYDSIDGINLISGDWVEGTGIVTDETGLIQVNWVENVDYVDINHLTVRVQRGSPGSGAFQVSANGIVFGVGASFTQYFPPALYPADFDGVIPIFAQPEPYDAPTNNANITIQADEPFVLHSVEVKGEGPNPFGVNTCGDLTPTPEITLAPTDDYATPEYTATPSPTATATDVVPTLTETVTSTPPTATATPDCAPWTYTIDFRTGPYTLSYFNLATGAYSAGVGYVGTYKTSSNFSDVSSQFHYRLPGPADITSVNVLISAQVADMARDVSWPGGRWAGGYTTSSYALGVPGSGWVTASVTLDGGGSERWYSMPGFPAANAHWLYTQVVSEYGYTPQSSFTNAVHAVQINGTGFNPFTNECAPIPTATATLTATPVTPTATPSLTPLPSLTPGTPLPSPTASRTAAPIYGPTYTHILATLPPNVPNTTPGTPVYTSTPLMTITVTPEGTPPGDGDSDGVFVPWGSYSGPDQTQSDIGEIGGALTNVTSNLFSLGSRYLGEFTGMIDQIVVGWRTSTPTVIPGMPRCQSDRLRSELCAIYYIIQYTILGDPLGTIVLQVAIIVIDLFIGVTFILLARSILEQLRRILHI